MIDSLENNSKRSIEMSSSFKYPDTPAKVSEKTTVLNFGSTSKIFQNIKNNHVFPLGYKSSRSFCNILDPESPTEALYIQEVVSDDDKTPQFVVWLKDHKESTLKKGASPNGCWVQMLKICRTYGEKHGIDKLKKKV